MLGFSVRATNVQAAEDSSHVAGIKHTGDIALRRNRSVRRLLCQEFSQGRRNVCLNGQRLLQPRDASMVAFNAKRLVCPEMQAINSTTPPIWHTSLGRDVVASMQERRPDLSTMTVPGA